MNQMANAVGLASSRQAVQQRYWHRAGEIHEYDWDRV